jgi:hypothetical protein
LSAVQDILDHYAHANETLRQKVAEARAHDPHLRCALPAQEALNAVFPLPPLPAQASLLAADGSQIAPDLHAEVEYSLVNVGAVAMSLGTGQPATVTIETRLVYEEEQLDNLTEATLALRRDLEERRCLARLAINVPPPAITFTDGQMELWGGQVSQGEARSEFQRSMEEYRQVLQELCRLQAVTAGYVDRPNARTLVRLLEIAVLPEDQMPEVRDWKPLAGIRDRYLFPPRLAPGERSAVFAIQSQFSASYSEEMALHFFYLNVGREGRPAIARVEAPAWVVADADKLNALHAVLIQQCRILGSRPYPYLLHRAHETALVTLDEHHQVTQMIVLELERRGIRVEGLSYKQGLKNLPGKRRRS